MLTEGTSQLTIKAANAAETRSAAVSSDSGSGYGGSENSLVHACKRVFLTQVNKIDVLLTDDTTGVISMPRKQELS